MQTRFSHLLLLHGYMTTRLSLPNHIVNVSFRLTSGAVMGSSSAASLGITNLNAAFPELKRWTSPIDFLAVDYAGS
jgi:hypothetical protein